MYATTSLADIPEKDIQIFCDASEKAIAAAAYLKATTDRETWRFILGKAKVSPPYAQTTPHLELCAAVLAVEISEVISELLKIQPNKVRFFTDSKIVLAYIASETGRFCVYVTVSRILKSTNPEQWSFVPTDANPADKATRVTTPTEKAIGTWLRGPAKGFEETNNFSPLVELDNQTITL
ncbi:uncharacterized protein LOC135477075 [Liolophura sinensis]|uniref:uncharacterized protein LOC135477075 n=1 Tax=Liolophura sinensis TaxID=3198878 RepID=UPI00315955ED